jgi:plasmid stabilization system protein ParE
MADPLRIHPLVYEDIFRATAWYDDQSLELGVDFAQRIRRAMDEVIASPYQRGRDFDGIRRRKAVRFPYVVIYEIEGNTVSIYAVVHTSQSDESWQERRDF